MQSQQSGNSRDYPTVEPLQITQMAPVILKVSILDGIHMG